MVLTDTVQVKLAFDLCRFGNINFGLLLPELGSKFFVQDLFAQNDAIIADKNAGAGIAPGSGGHALCSR